MEVTLSSELSNLIVSHRVLKNTNEKQIVLSIIFVMTVAFSTKLSFGLLFATLCIVEIVPANLFFGDFVSLISLSRWQFESDSVSNQQEIKF